MNKIVINVVYFRFILLYLLLASVVFSLLNVAYWFELFFVLGCKLFEHREPVVPKM